MDFEHRWYLWLIHDWIVNISCQKRRWDLCLFWRWNEPGLRLKSPWQARFKWDMGSKRESRKLGELFLGLDEAQRSINSGENNTRLQARRLKVGSLAIFVCIRLALSLTLKAWAHFELKEFWACSTSELSSTSLLFKPHKIYAQLANRAFFMICQNILVSSRQFKQHSWIFKETIRLNIGIKPFKFLKILSWYALKMI